MTTTKTKVRVRDNLRTRTVIKLVGDLSEEEYAECLDLTFCGNHRGKDDPGFGSMAGRLERDRKSGTSSYAVLLKDVGGTIVGWAIVFWYGLKNTGDPHIYMFVHPDARRMGIGSRLYRSARRRFGLLLDHRWDHRSSEFYRSVGRS